MGRVESSGSDNGATNRRLRVGALVVVATIALTGTGTCLATGSVDKPALMPYPSTPVAYATGNLHYSGRFDIAWEQGSAGIRLHRAVDRFSIDMRALAGVSSHPASGVALRIDCCDTDLDAATLEGQDEAYRLTISASGVALSAKSPTGVLRGLATLRQSLLVSDGKASLPFASVTDAPRFRWRGVMVDVSRHFMSVEALKRQLDAMELVKLNVLHLHLSDNEAFRVQSARYPKLTEGLQGEFYTQAQVRELVEYAAERGIRVVPEFDVPGHATAILAAYPQFASAEKAASMFGAVLDPSNPDTYAFVESLFGEMAALFPDRRFHVGGDEVAGDDWNNNPRITAFMREHGLVDAHALQSHFMGKVHAIVSGIGKHMVGWEEIAHDGTLPRDVTIQAWQSSNAIDAATKHGYPVIVSAGYYLDYLWPTQDHYRVDPYDPAAAGIDPQVMVKVKAIGNPALTKTFPDSQLKRPGLTLTEQQKSLVQGGEAALWSEMVTDELLDGRVWPRLAAIAERFWSPETQRDAADMQRRLVRIDGQLNLLALQTRGNMLRMAERLAPGNAQVVVNLANLVAPVRNFAHMQRMIAYVRKQPYTGQEFGQVADIALPDDTVAVKFNLDAADLVAGDAALRVPLLATMRGWKDNHIKFNLLAPDNSVLGAALPVSADIDQLADVGIEAIRLIDSGHPPAAGWSQDARTLIARLQQQERASSSLFATITSPQQPPADLLVRILPGVQALLDAAAPAPAVTPP